MSNRIVTRCASLLLAAFVIAGCSDDEPTGVDVLPMDVSPISFALDLGGTKQIKLTGATNADVTWESLNPAVASVDANGVVTGVAVGTTAITAVAKSDGFKSSATVQVNAVFGTQIAANTPITGLSAATGTQTLYRVFVPEAKTQLQVRIQGSAGDADVYTRFGTPPTFSTFACRPWLAGSNETCTHANPAEGSWYIWIDAYEGYSGLTLTATITP
jgi:hypothetical protein